MTGPLNGLNRFDEHTTQEDGFFKGSNPFKRFQWVLDGKLARSERPYYRSAKGHTVGPKDVYFLRLKKISCVISLYEIDMADAGKIRLATAGIEFHSFPVPDYEAPQPDQVRAVADLIDRHSATLVYCGAGCGRTGTLVAGWAKLKHRPYINGLNQASLAFLKANFGVEMPAQARVLNRFLPNGQIIEAPTPERRLSGVSMPANDMLDGFGSPAAMASFKSSKSSGFFIPPFANFSSGASDIGDPEF